MTAAEFAARLNATRSGEGWQARCPAHDDRTPSLSVREGRDGRVLVKCHAGCATESIVAAMRLGMADLIPRSATAPREEVAVYPYTNADGTLRYQVVRYAPKDFRMRQPDRGGWQWSLRGVRRVLYRLPDLRAAVAAGARVYVVEGEKDADAVVQAGAVATTNPGGAGKWDASYTEALRGAHVVVVADRDPPGRAHAHHVVRALHGVAASVALVEAAMGNDVSDHLAAGRTLGELVPVPGVPQADTAAPQDPSDALQVDVRPPTPETAAVEMEAALRSNGSDPLDACGLTALAVGADVRDAAACLQRLSPLVAGANLLESRVIRGRAIAHLKTLKVADASRIVDAAFTPSTEGAANPSLDLGPVADPQNGSALLDELAAWIARHVHFAYPEAPLAIAAWIMATWLVEQLHFAPLLVISSATKRAGKSTLLDLVRHVVRRGRLTSAFGASPAVVFRLNALQRPTFLLDEAERLAGRDADRDLVALLNQGHRRGGVVSRCTEKRGGGFDVEDFDAFGFRVLALIGQPWDTLRDRAIVIRLERKLKDAVVDHFAAREVERAGTIFAKRLRRWAMDIAGAAGEAEERAPRPASLNDRACDNWAPLFAVATLIGDGWSERMQAVAGWLQQGVDDDGDRGERLIRDVGHLFESQGEPAVIKSGDLAAALNALEESQWGDERHGQGLSTQRLAALFKPFGIRPRFARPPGGGPPVRGYWRSDIGPVCRRYYPPDRATAATGTAPLQDAGRSDPPQQGVTAVAHVARPGDERCETDPDEAARDAMRDGA